MHRGEVIGLIVLLILAASSRIGAARGSFWLDEVWSMELSRQVSNSAGILTDIHSDNNHPLNTLVMRLLGDQRAAFAYRFPVVALSVATVWLAWLWNKDRSTLVAMVAAAVMAISFPMIVYGSEARGYGYAGFFLLACLVCADRAPRHGGFAAGYVAAAIGGILAHPTFLAALGAISVWFIIDSSSRRRAMLLNVLPLAAAVVFWAGFVSKLRIGGSSETSVLELAIQTLSLAWSYAPRAPFDALSAIFCTLVTLAAFAGLLRRGDRRWILYLLGILFPIVAVFLQSQVTDAPLPLAPRYFFLPMVLVLLLWCDGLCPQRLERRLIIASAFVAVLFVGGNIAADVMFLKVGRGDFGRVMQVIAANGAGDEITVSADNNFRAHTMLRYYQRGHRTSGSSIRYIERADIQDLPSWMLVHSQNVTLPQPATLGQGNLRYERVETVPHYGPSGFTWTIYRRASTPD